MLYSFYAESCPPLDGRPHHQCSVNIFVSYLTPLASTHVPQTLQFWSWPQSHILCSQSNFLISQQVQACATEGFRLLQSAHMKPNCCKEISSHFL